MRHFLEQYEGYIAQLKQEVGATMPRARAGSGPGSGLAWDQIDITPPTL